MQSQFTINEQRFGSRCFNEFVYIEILKVRHNTIAYMPLASRLYLKFLYSSIIHYTRDILQGFS